MLGSTNFNDISGPLWMVRTLGNSYRVAAAYVCVVMEGIIFVCMDVGVAAAYVVFVMRDMLFVSMDVGDAAWGHPSISQGEGVLSKRLKHTKYELPPLGEG